MNLERKKTTTTPTSTGILVSLFLSLFLASYAILCSVSWAAWLAAALLVGALAVVLARAAVVAWITVLVLLAFSGKRRRVLVHEGRKITADVATNLMKVTIRQRGGLILCASAVSMLVRGNAMIN
ncbi:hypothetical protein Ancab_035801 [Ancistrocladus abbreviatus]